jgi:hypothetical protein
MTDLVLLVSVVALFGLAAIFVRLCERLVDGRRENGR